MTNKRFDTADRKILDNIVDSEDFKKGKISIDSLRKKFGSSWHVVQREITEAVQRRDKKSGAIETPDIPSTIIEKKEREELLMPAPELKNKPNISLIEHPHAELVENNRTDILDGSKFYCGTCLRYGTPIIIDRSMTQCPNCKGVLKWVN